MVLPGTIRVKTDNAIDYYSTTSRPLHRKPKKIFHPFVNTTTNPRVLHTLKHVEIFKLYDFKKFAHQFTWQIEISFSLHRKIYRDKFSVYIYHLLHTNYHICYCLSCTVTINSTSQIHKQCLKLAFFTSSIMQCSCPTSEVTLSMIRTPTVEATPKDATEPLLPYVSRNNYFLLGNVT